MQTPDEWLDAHVFIGGCHYQGPDRRGIVSMVATRQEPEESRNPLRAMTDLWSEWAHLIFGG